MNILNKIVLKEFFQKYTPGYKQGNSFQHMGSMSDIEYCFGRLYINCSKHLS